MPAPRPRIGLSGLLASLATLALGAALGVACGPPRDATCRFNPLCDTGELGATCNGNGNCRSDHCCKNNDCDGGTCTVKCDKQKLCPGGMTCHDKECYFACGFDGDCAPGQRCKDADFCSWD